MSSGAQMLLEIVNLSVRVWFGPISFLIRQWTSLLLPLAETAPCCRCWLVRQLVRKWRALYPGLSHGSWKEITIVAFFFAWTLKVAWGRCGVLWEALGSGLGSAPPSQPTNQSLNSRPEKTWLSRRTRIQKGPRVTSLQKSGATPHPSENFNNLPSIFTD